MRKYRPNLGQYKHKMCGAIGTLLCCWWECRMAQPLHKMVWGFPTKLNILFLHNPALMLSDIWPNELKTYVHTKNLHRGCLRQLYSQLPNPKTTKMSLSRWTSDKLSCIQIIEYHSAPKTNEQMNQKKPESSAIKIYGRKLNAYHWIKEVLLGTLLVSDYRTLWKQQNWGHGKSVSDSQGLEEKEGWIDRS